MRFPCFYKGTVVVEQVTKGLPVQRRVCERHAAEMVESGHFRRV